MISASLFAFSLFFGAFQFDFSGNDIEKHIEQKVLYFQQFTREEKEAFCNDGDTLSCKTLFLETLNSKEEGEDAGKYLDLMNEKEKSAGVYLYINEKWQDIPIETLKNYISLLPEEFSANLYSIYLKKLYLSGNVRQFMEDYRQLKSPSLTQLYVIELLKQDPEKGLSYLLSLNVVFPESFYDSMFGIVEPYSKKLSRKAYNEFRIWTLEYNYRKVRYKQAIDMATGWYPNKNYAKTYDWKAHLYRAMSYTKKREHTQAEAIYAKLEPHCANEELSDSDLRKFYSEYGYSAAALGKNEKAIELYLKAFDLFRQKDEDSAGNFLYQAADIARLAEKWEDAEKYFALFIADFPHSEKIGVARFLDFWINYKIGNFSKAKKLLSKIIADTNEMSYDHQRASYWLARVSERLGETQVSDDLYCMLATRIPASFYGSMAAARVKNKALTCTESGFDSVGTIAFHDEDMIPETEWLIAAKVTGDKAAVSNVLSNVSKIIDNNGREIDRLTASYVAKSINNHTLAANMLKSISNFSANSKEYFKLRYTIAFEEEILSHCDFYGISPIFVFSIARQESLFDTSAISTSYAIGLLQLLPSTAQVLANRENYGQITPQLLQRPLTNIRFGVKYLADLERKFDGSVPLAAASYNAGPGRIQKWIERDPERELDEFIEDIPIFQTRNYVKKVMTNYAVYHYIFYGEAYDGMNFKLPYKAGK